MKVHPAADLFPMMSEAELTELATDIQQNGQRHPLVLFEGKLLDGRNRLAACELVEVKPRVEVLGACPSPTAYVLSANLRRRHLTALQKAAVAAEAEPLFAIETKARQRAGGKAGGEKAGRGRKASEQSAGKPVRGPEAVTAAAKATGAGQKATRSLVTIRDEAPEVFAAVKAGTITKATDAKALGKLSAKDLKRALAAVEGGAKPKAAILALRVEKQRADQAAAPLTAAIVRRCDAAAFLESLEPASVDLLLTDPPYHTDVEDIASFAEWVHLALSRVKRTGRAYICTGAYPPELLAYLTQFAAQSHMHLANVLVWTYRNTIGPTLLLDYKLNWQAVFYLRGKDALPLDCPVMLEQFTVQDLNAPDGRLGNRYHAWQKPDELAERLIRHSTKPGDLVVDPFTCTGTFVLAAARLGRRGLGCDISEKNLQIAVERGCTLET